MADIERRIWAVLEQLTDIPRPADPKMRQAFDELFDTLAALSNVYTELTDELAAVRGTYRGLPSKADIARFMTSGDD